MLVEREEKETAIWYKISGALDHSSFAELQLAEKLFIPLEGKKITLDLCSVDAVDSSGIGVLLILCKKLLTDQKKLTIHCDNQAVREMLAFCQFPLICHFLD